MDSVTVVDGMKWDITKHTFGRIEHETARIGHVPFTYEHQKFYIKTPECCVHSVFHTSPYQDFQFGEPWSCHLIATVTFYVVPRNWITC